MFIAPHLAVSRVAEERPDDQVRHVLAVDRAADSRILREHALPCRRLGFQPARPDDGPLHAPARGLHASQPLVTSHLRPQKPGLRPGRRLGLLQPARPDDGPLHAPARGLHESRRQHT